MGVTYYICIGCDTGYRDDSDHACYCECGNNFCSKECGKLDNYLDPARQAEPDEDDPSYEDWINGECHLDKSKPITCIICRTEKYNDYVLLQALMSHFKLTQVVNIWRAESKK
jgi:hypothetical protein